MPCGFWHSRRLVCPRAPPVLLCAWAHPWHLRRYTGSALPNRAVGPEGPATPGRPPPPAGPRRCFFAHGHPRGICADMRDRGHRPAGLGGTLLPDLGAPAPPLHHALNLARGHVNAAGFSQVLLRFLIAHFIGPLQTQQPRQSRRVGHFQTQRGIGGIVSLFLARMVVIVTLQWEGAKDALQLQGVPPFPMLPRPGLVGDIQAIGGLLQEESHQRVGGLENGRAHQHLHLLNRGPGRLLSREPGHQLLDFLFLGEEEVGALFFCAVADGPWRVWATVRSTNCAASASNRWRLAMAACKPGASSAETRRLTLRPFCQTWCW